MGDDVIHVDEHRLVSGWASAFGLAAVDPVSSDLVSSPPLLGFDGDEDHGGQADDHQELERGERLDVEGGLQRGQVDRGDLQCGADGDCAGQRPVAGQPLGEQAVPLGADGEGVAELEEGESGEDHGLPRPAGGAADGLEGDCHGGHEQPDQEGVLPQASPEDRLAAGRGRRPMTSGSAGSTPRATAGTPSVIRLIHRICVAVRGTGSPRRGASSITQISPELVVSR